MKEYIIGVPERTGVEDPAMVPAINQRELVRCKDCKYWYNFICRCDDVSRKIDDCGCYPSFSTDPDWFCADGKRK